MIGKVFKKKIPHIALGMFFCAGGSLSAEEELRNSMMIMGGGGGYTYKVQPDLYTVWAHQYSVSALELWVPANDPIRLLADKEAYSPVSMEGKSTVYKMLFESLVDESKHLGLTLGFSHTMTTETCTQNCGYYSDLLFWRAFSSMTGSLSSSATMNLMMALMLSPAPSSSFSYTHTTLDAGLNYHFLPEGTIDPFLGVNIGGGTCSIPGVDGIMCTMTKYGGKLGFRLNFNRHIFLIVQGEADKLKASVSSSGGSGTADLPVTDNHALLGVGFNF